MIQDYVIFTGVNILLAWSVYIILMSGSLSFGNGAFMLIGAYVSGVLTVKFGFPLLLAAPLAGLATFAFGVLVGFPALRTRGIYLILVTVGIAVSVQGVIESIDYVGGVQGFGGMTGTTPGQVLAVVLVVGCALWFVSRSPLQRIFDAVREDELVARSLGINVVYVKLVGFGAGAFLAAMAGSFYGHYMIHVSPAEFGILLSVYIVLYVILGGTNNLWGPPLGAAIMTLVPEAVRAVAEWRPTVFGLMIIVLLLWRPDGLLVFRAATVRVKGWVRSGEQAAGAAAGAVAAHDAAEPILAVEGLGKHFGGLVALDSTSFLVRAGEILGLIGPNGAGKSVLVNVISGVYRASSGSVRYAGRDVTRLPAHELGRLGIARSYQNIRLFRRMTVLENVLVASKRHVRRPFLSVFARGRDADISAAMALLERVHLASKASQPAGSLSYGEARRLEIARALAGKPKLLFLDEPAAGMNERESEELAQVIRASREAVDSVVIIEHDVELIRNLSDRLLVMDSGRKIAEGKPAAVLADARVVEAYLGAGDDDDE